MKLALIPSRKRRKTVSARVRNGVLELRIPSWLSKKRAREMGQSFLKKIRKKEIQKNSDQFLQKRAGLLNQKYLRGKLKGFNIVWSERQKSIFGVCDQRKKEIRISSRLKKAPFWVIDYLVLHELVHFLAPGHGKKFWQIVNQFPRTEKAKGFLQGLKFREDY